MKRALMVALAVGLAIVFVNDLGRWVTTSYNLDTHLREIADNASAAARTNPQAGWPAAAQTAAKYGITVTGYSQLDQEVIVTAQAPVTGTWVTGPALALVAKRPTSTPFFVSARAQSYYH